MGKIPVWARVLIVTLIVVIIGWKTIASVATEYLWYQDLGYLGVFWKSLEARIAVAVAIFAVTFLFVAANLLSMKSASKAMPGRASLLLASIAGVLAAGFSTGLWMEFQQFVHATAFGKTDPIFGHDVGFYIFRYPFLREVYRGAVWVVGLSAVFVILVYLFSGSLIRFLQAMQLDKTIHRLDAELKDHSINVEQYSSGLLRAGESISNLDSVFSMSNPEEFTVVTCRNDGSKLRVRSGERNLLVTCPTCQYEFLADTATYSPKDTKKSRPGRARPTLASILKHLFGRHQSDKRA
jgi:hypothetical protein